MALNGLITAFIVTPANVDERLCLGELIGHIRGLLIIGQQWKTLLAAHDIDLQTPLRNNMADQRPQWVVKMGCETALKGQKNRRNDPERTG